MTQKIKERTIIKIFYRFLKEKNAFGFYFDNLCKHNSLYTSKRSPNERMRDMLCKYPSLIVILSFNWSNTPQGQEFWKTIHLQWIDIYCKVNFYLNTNLF